jgi:hypothetical protein
MSVETRARSNGGRHRGYGAYTAGANALRLDEELEVAIDLDDDDDRVERRAGGTRTRPARVSPPARVPRPRRRTPWVDDVTPAPAAPAAPALPVGLPKASFVALMAGLIVVGVVGVLVLHTKINEGSFRLSDLRSTQAALDQQEQQLEQQLNELSSAGNLQAQAIRLGLVPAGTTAFITLPDGRVVGVPQPAVP